MDVFPALTVLLSEFSGGEPVMVIRGFWVGKLIGISIQRPLPFGRALEQEPQVLQRKVVSDGAAIIGRIRFGPRVAAKRDEIALVDLLRDESPSRRRHALRGGNPRREHRGGGQKRHRARNRSDSSLPAL